MAIWPHCAILVLTQSRIKFQSMPRRLRALFLLLAIFCQTLILFSPLVVAERAAQLEHFALHSQKASHHHHDGEVQAVHMDEADGAVQHLHADAGLHMTGLPTNGWSTVAAARPLSPVETVNFLAPSPHLDGLLRPPRRNA